MTFAVKFHNFSRKITPVDDLKNKASPVDGVVNAIGCVQSTTRFRLPVLETKSRSNKRLGGVASIFGSPHSGFRILTCCANPALSSTFA